MTDTYEPFDADYCRDLLERVIAPISDHYFRPRFIGAEKLPDAGPLILAANHSGTAFPYDGIVLDFALWRQRGMTAESKLRTVFEPQLSLAWWMRPFGIDNLWRRGGGVDMTFDNFDRLLRRGDQVIYYPEGVPGIGKGFNRRYRLQRFSSSFLLLGARHDVPIYPVSIVNAEWVMPFHVTLRPLDRLLERLFHVPFLPLPLGVVAMVVPWMWYLALPAHLTFVVGDPIDARDVLRVHGVCDYERPSRAPVRAATVDVQRQMQMLLDEAVAEYGRHPYEWRSLLREWRRAGRRLGRVLPTGWPLSFVRYDRDLHRAPARNVFHAIARDIDLAAFYLPLVGWPLLSLARRLRRPPYGYRGLTGEQAAERQGAFVWSIAKRPLPPRLHVPAHSTLARAM